MPDRHARINSPSARAVRLLLRLMARGEATTAELARDLGEPLRVVRTDLHLLTEVAPVKALGERESRRWEIDPGLALVGRGMFDRIALQLGREVASFLRGTPLGPGSFAPFDGVPDAYARHLACKFRLLREPERDYSDHAETLWEVLDALLRERRMSFDYTALRGARRFEDFMPLTLVVYRRAVYLAGRTGDAGPLLRLAVDRIRNATVGEPFDYPSGWRPDRELSRWFGIHAPPDREPEPVVLRFTPRVADLVRARRWHATQRITDGPDGAVDLYMITGGVELVRFVLEWGGQCEVIAPDWLRDAVREELRAAIAQYREPRPGARVAEPG